jgi:hypothetical protein
MEITDDFCLKFELRLRAFELRGAPLDIRRFSMFDRMHLRRQRNFKMCLVLAR